MKSRSVCGGGPRPIAVVLIALYLVCLRDLLVRFFAAMISAEGVRAYSPIMFMQGAPRSHYASDHRVALWVADALQTPAGGLGSLALLCGAAWLWARAVAARRTGRGKAVVHLAAFELSVVGACTLFSAAQAYHHYGWGMDCNQLYWQSFLMLQPFAGGLAAAFGTVGVVLAALGRSIGLPE